MKFKKKQFAPRVSVFEERIKFYDVKQVEKGTVNEWFARIKNKAINCKFGARLDDYIKDKFVTGLRKGAILDEVCEEEHTSTAVIAVLEVARKREAALASSSSPKAVAFEETHYVKQSKTRYGQQKVADPKKKKQIHGRPGQQLKTEPRCVHCGETGHVLYICKICKKEGHLVKVCRNKVKSFNNSSFNHRKTVFKNEPNVDLIDIDMYKFESVKSVENPIVADTLIEGQSIPMEVDTGAGRSVISKRVFLKNFNHCKLEATSVRLRMYDGSILVPEGQILVKVKSNDSVNKI